MKHSALYGLILLLCLATITSCHNSSKKENKTQSEKQAPLLSETQQKEYYKRFEGTIGGQPAILQLTKTQSPQKEENEVGS